MFAAQFFRVQNVYQVNHQLAWTWNLATFKTSLKRYQLNPVARVNTLKGKPGGKGWTCLESDQLLQQTSFELSSELSGTSTSSGNQFCAEFIVQKIQPITEESSNQTIRP